MNLPSTSSDPRPKGHTISAHKKIKHLTKKYRRFRYLKDKRKRIDLNQFFSRRKETKELNFCNFFSKLNEINELDQRNEAKFSLDDDLSSPNSSSLNESQTLFSSNLLAANEDSENHLLELIKASSTIANRKAQRTALDSQLFSAKKETKKSSAAKHKERTIGLLNEFNRHENSLVQKEDRIVNEDILIDYFLGKIKECLGKEEQAAFVRLLEEFDLVHRRLVEKLGKPETASSSKSVPDEQDLNEELQQVYLKIKNLVSESSNGELIDEFLLFMNYEIVRQLNKQFDFNYWTKVKCFVQKIVIYLNQDSGALIRLIKLLKQLKQNESDLDKKRIRSALNKFLNSQPYLLNELNSLFLEEAPQEYLFAFNEDFDEVDLEEEMSKEPHKSDYKFETVNLNDSAEEDLYLTRQCPCKFCHSNLSTPTAADGSPPADQQTMRHCISCSLKYYKNKVYCCQENRKLHFTSIEYIDGRQDEEHPS